MVLNKTISPAGSTTDHVVINTAIKEVNAAGGGTVTLSAGTFTINGFVYMKSNVTLAGTLGANGQRLSKILMKEKAAINDTSSEFYVPEANRHLEHGSWSKTVHAMIQGSGNSNITIRDLIVDPNTAGYWYGTGWNDSYITRGRGYCSGIILSGGTNVTIYNCHINSGTRVGLNDGIQIFRFKGNVHIYGNTISPPMGHEGIYIKECWGTQSAHDNYVEASSNSAIRSEDCDSCEIYNNHCVAYVNPWKNTVLTGPGIQLSQNYLTRDGGYSYQSHYNVHDNYINGFGGPGMSITSKVASSKTLYSLWVHHNIITRNAVNKDANWYCGGIHVGNGCPYVNIENNTIDNNYGNGIALYPYLGGGTKNCVTYVNNNQITNTKAHASSSVTHPGHGVANYIGASDSTFVITSNNIWGNAGNLIAGDYRTNDGNISINPLYVVAGSDYHLQSNFGSYHQAIGESTGAWVIDKNRSDCIRLTGSLAGTEIGRFNGNWQQSRQSTQPNIVVPPVASFSGTPISGTAPLTVKFTDTSLNSPTSWKWNFGDSTTSTERHPSHTYSTVGTYVVSMSATNSAGTNTTSTGNLSITVTNKVEIPVASFSASPISGLTPLSVQFTNTSSNNPTTFSWDFGDSSTSIEQNPLHIYSKSGNYTVTLTVSNTAGSNTTTKTSYIKVEETNPYVNNTYDNIIQSTEPTTTFTNLIYGAIGQDGNGICRTLFWFNLDSYTNKKIRKATLKLYWYYPTIERANDTVLEVYRPAKIWNPNTITWSDWTTAGGSWYDKDGTLNGNVAYDSVMFSKSNIADNNYCYIDVTDLVEEYITNKYTNVGFLLKAKTELNNLIKFYSFDCGTSIAVPILEVIEDTGVPIMTTIYVAGDGSGNFNCDGIDDHIQINQAIKLVKDNPTLYSGVYLKGPFTYNINSTILVAGLLEGDETTTVKLINNANWAANIPMFKEYATGLNGITIKGFKIDGNRGGNTNVISGKYYYNLINIDGCTNVEVKDMYLTNNHGDGLYVTSCSNVSYHDNTVYLLGHDGLYAVNCNYVDAYNNNIVCRTNSGLRAYNTNNVAFYYNDISSEGSGGCGIEIQKYGTPVMTNIEIYGNRIHDTVLAGIWLFGSSSYNANTANAKIHNNVIYGCGTKNTDNASGGIVINGFNADIENNTIDDNYKSGIGIREAYTQSAVITGTITINIRSNNITYTEGYGIDYTTLANHTIIQQNNDLYQNTSGNYNNVAAPTGTVANLTVDPLYVDRSNHNYYLKSKAGRWNQDTNKWTTDYVNSPCIDAGYALSDYSKEQVPNGNRVNIGAYGNTNHASFTGDTPVATNHAPILTEIPNKTVEIGSALTFTVNAYDEDNDVLTYTITSAPNGATLNSSTGAFSWTPVVNQEGTYKITFTVSDGVATDTQEVTIGVIKQETFTVTTGTIVTNRLKESEANAVFNALPYIEVGARTVSGSSKRLRTLIMADLSAYAGKTITSAVLSIYWYFPDGKERVNDTIVEVYRPLTWDSNYACWNKRTSSNAWVQPGGDWFDSAGTLNGNVPYASTSFGNDVVPDNAYHTLNVTSLVQAYVNGTYSNTGFLLKAQTEDENWIAFYSQNWAANAKLKLTVQYTS